MKKTKEELQALQSKVCTESKKLATKWAQEFGLSRGQHVHYGSNEYKILNFYVMCVSNPKYGGCFSDSKEPHHFNVLAAEVRNLSSLEEMVVDVTWLNPVTGYRVSWEEWVKSGSYGEYKTTHSADLPNLEYAKRFREQLSTSTPKETYIYPPEPIED